MSESSEQDRVVQDSPIVAIFRKFAEDLKRPHTPEELEEGARLDEEQHQRQLREGPQPAILIFPNNPEEPAQE